MQALFVHSRRSVDGLVMRQVVPIVWLVTALGTAICRADDLPQAKGEAPPNHSIVGSKLGGRYFAPQPLKEQYDRLVNAVRVLETEILEGRIDGAKAAIEIRRLRSELERARKELEAQKVFVPAARIHTQSDTTTFDLGPESCLLIVADRVRLVGWDGPGVKCVLEKVVLSADDAPVDDHFNGIQLVHRHGPAAEEVGRPAAELEAEEQAYLAGPEGKKLSPAGVAFRRNLNQQIVASRAVFQPLQGKPLDVIRVEGLTHEQGNRQISLEVSSAGGAASHSSDWQRHANLVVYVPPSKTVGLLGGLGGLEVESLKAGLVIKGQGNRDYDGTFTIKDVEGPLAAENVPLQHVENVRGNVAITASVDLGNSGTRHADDSQTSYVEPPKPCVYRNIEGDFQGWFLRSNLTLSAISGKIDVKNEFGDTVFVAAGPLADASHRIVSEAGHIELRLAGNALGELPLLLLTESGLTRIPASERSLESVHFEGYPPGQLARRAYRGFITQRDPRAGPSLFGPIERAWQALQGLQRSAGVDIVNRGGSIHLTPVE